MPGKRKRLSWPAMVLILVGIVFLLANLEILFPKNLLKLLFKYWPMIFVGIGLSRLLFERTAARWRGLVPLMAGLLLQLFLFGWLPGDLTHYWSIGFLLWGVWLLVDRPGIRPEKDEVLDTDELVVRETLNTFKVNVRSGGFRRADITSTLSFLHINLRETVAAMETVPVTVDCFLSRLLIRVPAQWDVETSLNTFFGRRVVKGSAMNASTHLRIEGSIMFGAIHITREKE